MKLSLSLLALICLVPTVFGQTKSPKASPGKVPASTVAVRPKAISGKIASISSQDAISWKIEYKGVTYIVDVSKAKFYLADGKLSDSTAFKEGTEVYVAGTYPKKQPTNLTASEVRELKLLVKTPNITPKRKAPRKRGG